MGSREAGLVDGIGRAAHAADHGVDQAEDALDAEEDRVHALFEKHQQVFQQDLDRRKECDDDAVHPGEEHVEQPDDPLPEHIVEGDAGGESVHDPVAHKVDQTEQKSQCHHGANKGATNKTGSGFPLWSPDPLGKEPRSVEFWQARLDFPTRWGTRIFSFFSIPFENDLFWFLRLESNRTRPGLSSSWPVTKPLQIRRSNNWRSHNLIPHFRDHEIPFFLHQASM